MMSSSSTFGSLRAPPRSVRAESILHGLLLLLVLSSKGVSLPLLEINEDKNCNRIKTIQDGLNGTIKTVDYPAPYPARSYCEIQLIGNATHRAMVRFEKFYLHHPMGKDHDNSTSCDGLDKLRIYDGIRDQGVLLGEFCGRMKPKPVMSSGSDLTLNLTSYSSGKEAIGFLAHYAFVSDYGITSGEQILIENCSFHYDSEWIKNGTITSPNPGGIYPRNTNCTYKFQGDYHERLLLKFEYFDLEGIEPCTASSGSDYLAFSSLPGNDPCPARRCGRFAPQEVVSEGPHFRVNFVSNGQLDGIGFNASFYFLREQDLPKWVLYTKNPAACLTGEALGFTLLFLLLLATRFSFQPYCRME